MKILYVAACRILPTTPNQGEPSLDDTRVGVSRRHCIEFDIIAAAGINYDAAAVAKKTAARHP